MMDESYYLGMYWGARAESPRAIAERLSTTMVRLGECDELLGRWNEQANSYREALRLVVEPKPEAIEPLFTTIEPARPTRFGHDLLLWNGREASGLRCKLRLVAGKVPTIPGDTGNRLLLYPPYDLAQATYTPAVMARVMVVLVQVWQPDSAVMMSDEYEERHVFQDDELPIPGKPRVGWMTYLRAERLTGLPAQVPCKTVDIDDLGTLFIVTDEHRFSADNPEDVARAQALTAFLEEHGALETIAPNLPM